MENGWRFLNRSNQFKTPNDEGMNALMDTDSPPGKKLSHTKRAYIRSRKLLQLVSELDCQLCGSGVFVQAAHTNWGGGKGRSIKADDNLVAALCMHCHYDIDQGAKWSKRERQQAWWAAHRKTVDLLVESGRWPLDVPVPSDTEWQRLFTFM